MDTIQFQWDNKKNKMKHGHTGEKGNERTLRFLKDERRKKPLHQIS
jgi:hypothetical protein